MQRRNYIPPRRTATQSQLMVRRQQQAPEEMEEDFPDDPPRMPSSARRYYDTRGNRRLVIHDAPPPKERHWLVPLGIGMVIMVILFFGINGIGSWWNNHQLDAQYGMPRIWQTDQLVGHNDSPDHPTHFIFLNLNSHVLIIEIPGDDSSKARIYSAGQIYSADSASTPITGTFEDVNGDGKIDMIVHIGDQRIVYLNDGAQFKPQP
jgi:hypothetical protein